MNAAVAAGWAVVGRDADLYGQRYPLIDEGFGASLGFYNVVNPPAFRDNLRRFIAETRARGATPILATPVCRRKFDREGKLVPTHGAYPEAVRAVAREEKTPLLELEQATARWLQAEGDEPSRRFFMWIAPGTHPKIPDGRKDDTHFVAAGAEAVAALAAAEIRSQAPALARWLRK